MSLDESITVSRQAFRELAQRLADPNMTDKERAHELARFFAEAEEREAEP